MNEAHLQRKNKPNFNFTFFKTGVVELFPKKMNEIEEKRGKFLELRTCLQKFPHKIKN